jgi:hypothetical protein
MKKIISLISCVAFLFVFISCSNAAGGSDDNGDTDAVVGTWKLSSITNADGDVPFTSLFIDSITRTFKSDNTAIQITVIDFLGYSYTTTMNATWSVSNGVYTITDTTDSSDTTTFTISGSTMTESITDSGTTYSYIYTKQ